MKKILLALAIVIAGAFLIQLVPYGKAANPPVRQEPKWDSARTRELFFRSCRNCHSNETQWPAYSRLAPLSWLVRSHVDRGRSRLNVSEWGRAENKGDEAAEMVRTGEMPPLTYRLVHPEEKLSPAEREELVRGLARTFGDKQAAKQGGAGRENSRP